MYREISSRHDWTTTIVGVISTCVINLIVFAFGYGILSSRVSTLEQLRAESREELRQQLAEIKTHVEQIDERLRRRDEAAGNK